MGDGELEASTVPSALACDLKRLSLDRLEAFVLSQIDGSSSLDELASLAGLPIGEVRRIVRRLHELGTVNLPGHARKRPPSMRRPSSRSLRAIMPNKPEPLLVFLPTSIPRLTGKSVTASGAKEAFLLAQVDGTTTVSDLAAIAGLEVGPLTAVLNKLARAGALELKAEGSPAPSPPRGGAAGKQDGRRETPPRVSSAGKHDGRTETSSPPRGSSASKQDGRAETPPPRRASSREGRAVASPRRASSAEGRAVDSRRASSDKVAAASRRHQGEPTPAEPAPPRTHAEAPPRSRTQPTPREEAPGERPPVKSSVTAKAPAPPASREHATATAAAADDTCELEPETQARLTELYGRLATATHYDMLGVAREADKKAIKSAFYAFVATLHPDRHFRKKLGPFKQKLNDVFVRLSLAYETLSKADTRADYDRRLPPLPKQRQPAPAPAPAAPPAPPPRAAAPEAAPQSRAYPVVNPAPQSRAYPVVDPAPQSRGYPVVDPANEPPAVHVTDATRREAFASRLGRPASVPPPAPAPSVDPGIALRRFFEEKVERSGRQRARVFADAAEHALAKGDVIAAANHFKLALDCCEAPEIRAAYEAAEEKARTQRFEINLKQGQEAERAERWEVAAKRYAKAYGVKPEPRIGERLANAIRLHGGDLRRAVKVAEEAALAEPQNAAYRVTLGEVYDAAGLALRARAEAERAVAMAPADPRAKALLEKTAKAR